MLDICDLDNIEHGDNVEISTKHSVKDASFVLFYHPRS